LCCQILAHLMKHLILSSFATFLLLLFSCDSTNETQLQLNILEHVYYDNLSSTSGVSVIDNIILMVGDDIPWLVQLNNQLEIINQISISGIDSIIGGRMPYQLKPDYECMESFTDEDTDYTIVLSSGSKSPSRDTAVLISHTGSHKLTKQNIRPLFELIKTRAEMGSEEINIEGLAVTDESVYFFHRGNVSGNFIAELNREDFLHYIVTGHFHQQEINIYNFDLPTFNEVKSGFSGACHLPEKESFLFTASLEDTKSVTSDGKVSGSYIGIIPIKTIDKGKYSSTMLKDDVKILPKKLEGISILSSKGNETSIVTVCDNDDGSSDIFIINIKIYAY